MILGGRFAAWVKASLRWVAEMLATKFPTDIVFRERMNKRLKEELEDRYPSEE